jgi:hypothetical protein
LRRSCSFLLVLKNGRCFAATLDGGSDARVAPDPGVTEPPRVYLVTVRTAVVSLKMTVTNLYVGIRTFISVIP